MTDKLKIDGTTYINNGGTILKANIESLLNSDVGLGNVQNTKVNLAASVAPTTTDDTGSGYSVGSRWIDTTADKEYVCLDATASAAVWTETTSAGGGGASDLAVVQARRTTTPFAITTSFVSVTLDTTDIENDATVIEHNNTTTSRIDIKANGLYFIDYRVTIMADTTERTTFSQVIKGGATVLPGSEVSSLHDKPSAAELPVILGCGFYVSLVNTDYIELQLKDDVGGISTSGDISLSVAKMDGVQGATGATGATGADGDITWEGAWSGVTSYTTNQAVTHNGTSYVCILNHTNQEPPNGTYWEVLASKGDTGPAGTPDIVVTTHTNNSISNSVTSATWTPLVQFIFSGTTALGTPTNIKASAWVTLGASGGVKIRDITNSLDIATVTNISSTTVTIVDLGTLSNLPTGEAIWEVQVNNDGVESTNISSVIVQF